MSNRDDQNKISSNYNNFYNDREKKLSLDFSSSKTTGFFETEASLPGNDPVGKMIVTSMTKQSTYENILILKIMCEILNSPSSISARLKEFSWKIDKGSSQSENMKLSGESMTDSDGFVRLRFTTTENLGGKTFHLNFGNSARDITLGSGPYEIVFPEDVCKNKKR